MSSRLLAHARKQAAQRNLDDILVHVDDENVVEVALGRLLAGMGEKPGGVQLVDRYASAAFSEEVHGSSPDVSKIRLQIPAGRTRVRKLAAGPALPHAKFE